MKTGNFIAAFVVLLSLCVLVAAQVAIQPRVSGDAESLRQILTNPPNYTAVQQFLFSEGFSGFGANSKVAKLGTRHREESDDTIFINEVGKPTIKIYPKRKVYSEQPIEDENVFQLSPDELAKRDDVVFKLLGKEKIGKHDCLKIEATYKDEKLKEMVFVFYVAPVLRNLVIREEISLGEQVKFITELSDVSFNVSEKLFLIPTGYKKIVEPSPNEEKDNLLRQIKPV